MNKINLNKNCFHKKCSVSVCHIFHTVLVKQKLSLTLDNKFIFIVY